MAEKKSDLWEPGSEKSIGLGKGAAEVHGHSATEGVGGASVPENKRWLVASAALGMVRWVLVRSG